MLRRLLQALLAPRHRANLTAETHFAKNHQIPRQWPVAKTRDDGQQGRQVGAGLDHLDATDHIDKHILVTDLQAPVTVQYCQQHGQAIGVGAYRHPPRVPALTVIDQRLQFNQQRPGALPHHHHYTARTHLLATRQKDRRRIFYLPQALFTHGKNAELIDCAKTIFVPPQGAKAAVATGLQHQEAVDHMLQYLGSGEGAVLGDMADQHQDSAGLLGEANQQRGALAHLGDAAGSGLDIRQVAHLNRIDHQYFWFQLFGSGNHGLDIGFAKHLQFVGRQAQALGAQGNLRQGFLAADVECGQLLREVAEGLQQ